MPRRRILSLLMCLLLLIQLIPLNVLAVTSDGRPDTPEIIISDTDKPKAGYDSSSIYPNFIDINWKPVSGISGYGVDYKVTIEEIDNGVVGTIRSAYVTNYSATEGTARILGYFASGTTPEKLSSGKVYNVYVTAYYYKSTQTGVETIYGDKSIGVAVMTNIYLEAETYGSNQIKITWDDAWLQGKRIGYEIYVADSSGTSTDSTNIDTQENLVYETAQMVPDGSKITASNGKLSYIHTVADGGKVYGILIKPLISGTQVYYNDRTDVAYASSYIMVYTTKLSDTDNGSIWQLDWSNVDPFGKYSVDYIFYKNGDKYDRTVNNNNTYNITVPTEDKDCFYKIIAKIRDSNGNQVFSGLVIQSDKIYFKESEVAVTPTAPEFLSEVKNSNDITLASYNESLKSTSADILWKLPEEGDGDIDYKVTYDMWLTTDQDKASSPDNTILIASDVPLSGNTLVKDDTGDYGAKYQLSNLKPNTSYYFVIQAKKTFVEYTNGNVSNVVEKSQYSTKLVTTPPEDSGNQPVALTAPPLELKTKGETTATITIKNNWYEKFNSDKNRWEYNKDVTADDVTGDVYGKTYRVVQYDNDVTLNVGLTKVPDSTDVDVPAASIIYNEINDETKYPTTFMTGIASHSSSDATSTDVDINLTGLEPNTSYIIWVRAVRTSTNAVSNASDTIYLTTNPNSTDQPVKPPVPSLYGYAGDTYVELRWNYNTNYTYVIKYSTDENLDKASNTITITGAEMASQKLLKITGLTQSTNYYFWIEAYYGAETNTLGFGDAYHLMTTEFTPPDTPYGFGIKGGSDSVTKGSITYEWLTVTGLEYILEIANNIDYKNSIMFEAGTVSEFQVTGLNSNTKYYARLYAYDTVTKLKSEPTQSIIARTLKSKDDYDTDEDTDTVISGDFIVKDTYASGQTWNITITGVNADRFLEDVKNGKYLNYKIDLTNPPSSVITTKVTVAGKVFSELSKLGRTVTFSTEDYSISFGPGTLDFDTSKNDVYTNYILELSSGVTDSTQNPDKIAVKTKIGRVGVKRQDGTGYDNILNFAKPALVSCNLTDASWYDESNSFCYTLDSNSWSSVESKFRQDSLRGKDFIDFDMQKPGDFLAGQQVDAPYSDVFGNWASDYIKTLSTKVNLKSVQGSYFKPDSNATIGDTVKMVFDTVGYNYSANYLQEAYKAGLINRNDASAANSYCTTEKAIYMIMTIYERKSGETLTLQGSAVDMFDDMNSVSDQYRDAVYFAVENGIYPGKDKYKLNPTSNITRGELAAILVKYLEFTGQI